MPEETRQFAFGTFAYKGHSCPLGACGYDVQDYNHERPISMAADRYDEEARTIAEADEGTLPEEKAKEAWRRANEDKQLGQEVMEELGWT